MKKLALVALICFAFTGTAFAQSMSRVFFTSIAPVTSTYQARTEDGEVNYERLDVTKKGTAMGFSGTSICQVNDLFLPGLQGYFTFQMKSLQSSSGTSPTSGTTISAFWRGSNMDTPAAWDAAVKNTIFYNMNALTGATGNIYPLMSSSVAGVTAVRYLRVEFMSGASVTAGTATPCASNLIPIGVLLGR